MLNKRHCMFTDALRRAKHLPPSGTAIHVTRHGYFALLLIFHFHYCFQISVKFQNIYITYQFYPVHE